MCAFPRIPRIPRSMSRINRIQPRRRRPEWSAIELTVLREGYGSQSIGTLAFSLRRTKQAIRSKARDMGLQAERGERGEPKILDHTPTLKATMPHDIRVSDDWEQTTDARLGSLRLLRRLQRYHPEGHLDLTPIIQARERRRLGGVK